MKTKTFLLILALAAAFKCPAQLLWLEGGLDIFGVTQEGKLYIPDTSAQSLYVGSRDVDRGMSHFGIIIEGFYPINFGSTSYEHFATGPVFGFSLTQGRKKLSYDPAYQPKEEKFFNNGTGNLHMPLFWSIRIGNMVDVEKSYYGFELAAGMQFTHLNTADEKGWSALPAVRGAFQYRKFSFAMCYYFIPYTSYYNVNGEEIPRLQNKMSSIEIKYAFDWWLGRVD
ncbi:MAG TPA: hypothetical protein VK826_15325 [Bacteroidia bacterium]|nr:hypothetical protein [Bacteroidia bacterium]